MKSKSPKARKHPRGEKFNTQLISRLRSVTASFGINVFTGFRTLVVASFGLPDFTDFRTNL
jgi:hypothetical protein